MATTLPSPEIEATDAGRNSPLRPGSAAFDERRAETFPILTRAQIARMATIGTQVRLPDGAVATERGQSDVPFWVVLAGELEVISIRGSEEQLVAVQGAGEFVGELAVLAQGRAITQVRARGEAVVLRV